MKGIIVLLVFILVFSCSENADTKKNAVITSADSTTKTVQSLQQTGKTWIENFREFRDAVYQDNRAKVKTFIDFPVMNENNEIWFLEGMNSEGASLETIKPFTGQDFDKYYEKLFPKTFIDCILKIKTAELYAKGETETITLKDSSDLTYKIYATFEKPESLLTLNMAFVGVTEDGLDPIEYNIAYMFRVTADGQIKFKQVRIAG